MVNILLVCAGGMSTSALVLKMQDVAKNKGIEAKIWAIGEAQSKDEVPKADIILLGPQIRYLEKKMKERVNNSKPVIVIDMVAYGKMDGEKVLDIALSKLGK